MEGGRFQSPISSRRRVLRCRDRLNSSDRVSYNLFGARSRTVKCGGNAPSNDFTLEHLLHNIIVVRIDQQLIRYYLSTVCAVLNMQAGMMAILMGVAEMKPVSFEDQLQHLWRKRINSVLAKADGWPAREGPFHHLLVFNNLIALVTALYRPRQFSSRSESGKPFFRSLGNRSRQHLHHH